MTYPLTKSKGVPYVRGIVNGVCPFTREDLLSLFGHCKFMACFETYFDESGTHDTSLFTLLGGAVGRRSSWLAITGQWSDALRAFGVTHFHSTDLANFYGEYENWNEINRQRFINRLLKILSNEPLIPLFAAVKNDTFDSVCQEFPDFPITPYQFCCEWGMRSVMLLAKQKKRIAPVAVTFESGQQAKSPYMIGFQPAHLSVSRQRSLGIGRVNFADKIETIPLQVADLVAYETWKEICEVASGGTRAVRYPLKKLAEKNGWPKGDIVDETRIQEYLFLMHQFFCRSTG